MRAIVSRLTASLIALAHSAGAQPTLPGLDTTFARLDRELAAPAVGMVVWHRGRVVYERHAGFADLERGVRASPATRYDLASIAKQFTAYAVAQLVEQGALQLDVPARRYLPELDLGGSPVTVAQLLHHTAGLEDVDGLYAIAGGRTGDPVTHADLVHLLVRQQHLRFAPGTQFAYSNGGYTLLAEIVARLVQGDFVAHTDTAVFARLGMQTSGFLRTPMQLVPHRALPYVRDVGGGYQASTSDLYPAAGGLFATMGDMARWMAHVIRPTREEGVVRRVRMPAGSSSGDATQYGWGIGHGVYRGRAVLQHGGSGPATSSHLLMIPDLDFGVVASVAGEVDVNPYVLAQRAADLVLGAELGPVVPPAPGRRMILITDAMMREVPPESRGVALSPRRAARFAGTYRSDAGEVVVILPRGDSLYLAREGNTPWFPLFPLPDGRFMTMPLRRAYRFEAIGDEPAHQVVQETGPQSPLRDETPVTFTRLTTPPFTEATAAPFVGLYYSDELGTVYEVVREGDALVLHHARHGRLPLRPLGGTRFAIEGGGLVGVVFSAAADGRMAGLELEARSWGVRSAFRRLAAR